MFVIASVKLVVATSTVSRHLKVTAPSYVIGIFVASDYFPYKPTKASVGEKLSVRFFIVVFYMPILKMASGSDEPVSFKSLNRNLTQMTPYWSTLPVLMYPISRVATRKSSFSREYIEH